MFSKYKILYIISHLICGHKNWIKQTKIVNSFGWTIACQFLLINFMSITPIAQTKLIECLPSLSRVQNFKRAAVWSFSATQRHVMHIKPLRLPQLRAISWALLWKGNSWLQVRERVREQSKERPGVAVFFQPCASVRRYFILSMDSHSCHHPISVYLHKDSYCPAGDRPLTRSICTALVISEGHAAQPEGVQGCERDGGGQREWKKGER